MGKTKPGSIGTQLYISNTGGNWGILEADYSVFTVVLVKGRREGGERGGGREGGIEKVSEGVWEGGKIRRKAFLRPSYYGLWLSSMRSGAMFCPIHFY